MIVKNELNHLQELLPILEKMNDNIEIIIVDTGSTDGSKEFLKNKNNIIFQEMVWNQDFSAARNISLDLCTGDYILVLDADERPDESFYPSLLNEINKDEEVFSINFLNLDDDGVYKNTHETIRLFKNDSGYFFKGKIHEQISNEKTFTPASSNLYVNHLGYAKTEVKRKDKHKRNKDILLTILKDEPNNLFARINLIQDYMSDENYKKALKECNKILSLDAVPKEYLLRLYKFIIRSYFNLKDYEKALTNINIIRNVYPGEFHFLLEEGFVLLELGRLYDAEISFKKIIENFTSAHSIFNVNDTFYALSKLLVIYIRNRHFFEFEKTFLIIKNLQNHNSGIETLTIKHSSVSMDEEQLYTYIINSGISIEKKEELFFEYHNIKGIEEISLKEISSNKNRVLKLWYLKKYTQAINEYELLDNADKNKISSVLYVQNIEKKNKLTTELLKKDHTLSMLMDVIDEKKVLNKNYSGVIYLSVIEELIKCKNFIVFEKLIAIFPMFSHSVTLKIAEYLDSFYFYDDMATSLYFEYLVKNPTDGAVWTRLAELLYANKQFDDAYTISQRAVETNPLSFRPIEILLNSLKEKNLLNENIVLINNISNLIGPSPFMENIQSYIINK
jgi:glycosyltransferase involved in cell wall biosynthesis